jgi:PRTRC genetic system protein A
MPYGALTEEIVVGLNFSQALLKSFCEKAAEACPFETVATLVWNQHSDLCGLREGDFNASRDRVSYKGPRLLEGEWLVGDIHSHGHDDAFFSPTDDQDDGETIKIALVVGRCQIEPQIKARLCLQKIFIDLVFTRTDAGVRLEPDL